MPETSWLAGLAADLRLVSAAGACLMYGAWTIAGRPGLLRLARLGLAVAVLTIAASLVLAFRGLGPVPALVELYAFAVVLGFVGLEILFQLSVLGVGAALLLAAASAADHMGWLTPYLAGLPALGDMPVTRANVAAYWGWWRDGFGTIGAAALTLGVGASLALGLRSERRNERRAQPSDLRDASSLLARIALVTFWLALPAAVLAAWNQPVRDAVIWMHAGALAALALHAPAWMAQAEGRGWNGRRTVPLVGLGIIAVGAFLLGDSVIAHLTLAPTGP